MSVRVRLASPPGVPAALAVIDLFAQNPDELHPFIRIHANVRADVGDVKLVSLQGVDQGLLMFWSRTFAQITPHGGTASVDEWMKALVRDGAALSAEVSPEETYLEARSAIDARALAALARAHSPLAVDLLLAQHERWGAVVRSAADASTGRDVRLHRLIDPALVVVTGPPNVGKSTLLNALAGRELALASPEAGTTRDHVGALVDLGGLVVRWVDTPGVREARGAEARAIGLAREVLGRADLVIAVGDAGTDRPTGGDVVVALRADLGLPWWEHDAAVSARTGAGMGELVALVRERLVPRADLESAVGWRFW